MPAHVLVGLLTRPPNADGYLHEEAVSEGYGRQPLTVTGLTSGLSAGSNEVIFHLVAGAAMVTHVGLFDADGGLLFYGFLSGSRRRSTPPQEFAFPRFALKLKATIGSSNLRLH